VRAVRRKLRLGLNTRLNITQATAQKELREEESERRGPITEEGGK